MRRKMSQDTLHALDSVLNVTFATTGITNATSNTTAVSPADVFRTVAFLTFLIVGFTLNCVQISVIVHSSHQQTSPFSIQIVSLAFVNLVDCLGNIPSTVPDARIHGRSWYNNGVIFKTDCLVLYLVGTVMIIGLLFMSADRLVAIRRSRDLSIDCPHALTPLICARVMVVYSWMHGILLCLAFLIPECQGRIAYLWTMAVLGFVVPAGAVFGVYGFIFYTVVQQRNTPCQAYTADSVLALTSMCLPDSCDAKYVASLLLAWFFFQVPLLVTRFIVLVRANHEDDSPSNVSELQIGLRWLFVAYTIVLPVLTFFWKRETCLRLKNVFLCHKTNIVVDSSPIHLTHSSSPSSVQQTPVASCPVLFATSKGLHVQTYDTCTTKTSSSNYSQVADVNGEETMLQRCDVFGSFYSGNVLSEDGNTSDYDSTYDFNSFILANNPTVVIAACDDPSSLDAKNGSSTEEHIPGDDRSRGLQVALQCTVSEESSDINASLDEKVQIHRLNLAASAAEEIKRCRGDSGCGSMELAINGKRQKVKISELDQDKHNDETLQNRTERGNDNSRRASIVDFRQKQSDRKQGTHKRKQRKSKSATSRLKRAAAADDDDSQIHDSKVSDDPKGLCNNFSQNIERISVEQIQEEAISKVIDRNDGANNDDQELKRKRHKRNRQTSESNNNLLDSSNTSSELAVLQSAYHHE